jgi:cytochrome c553
MQKLSVALCLLLAAGAVQAQGNAEAGQAKAIVCAGCHGADGNSPADLFPKLAGQHASYIVSQLKAFKSEERIEPQMTPFVAMLSDEDMDDVAAYFATQTVQAGTPVDDAVLGKKIYIGGNLATGVSSCSACHNADAGGNPSAHYPSLKGQHAGYVVKQLNSFKDGSRSGNANAKIMVDIAKRMSAEEINAVAAFITTTH